MRILCGHVGHFVARDDSTCSCWFAALCARQSSSARCSFGVSSGASNVVLPPVHVECRAGHRRATRQDVATGLPRRLRASSVCCTFATSASTDDRASAPWSSTRPSSTSVVKVFATLYAKRFPLHSMIPESNFQGHDPASMAADNTSGFNCRYAVTTGPKQWSVHAYGEAIDVNPVQNPYVFNGVAQPVAGKAYVNRSDVRPGMAELGGVLNDAFASVGWFWGGRWSASPDYQHFSSTGG